ncbi:MAG: co-chaperone GroES [Clostridiales bacterium]|nr:MAG: co-chaperone GroES [Clostridiales bacterium]
MNIKPIGDKVVIKPIAVEEVTKSGIVLPGSAQEKPQQGEVIAVGDGIYQNGVKIPMELKVGDRVVYGKFGGIDVKLNNEEVIIMSEKDVLIVLQ